MENIPAFDPPTAAELERCAEEARIDKAIRVEEEKRTHLLTLEEKRKYLLTLRTSYCKRFSKCSGRSFLFGFECSSDTMKDVKSEAAMTRIGKALNPPPHWGVKLRSATIGVTETGDCRTIRMAIDLETDHAVPAIKVMTALHSAFDTFDGEIIFLPGGRASTFWEKARRILAPDGPEPVDVDPDPYVYHKTTSEPRDDDGRRNPVYVQLQVIQNSRLGQELLRPINLFPSLGMGAAFVNVGAASRLDDAKKMFQECGGSWKKLMSTALFTGHWGGSRNPLLFRACFDMLSRPATLDERPDETYKRFVQEEVYGISRKRPREETVEETARAIRKLKRSSLSSWAACRLP